MLKTLHIKALAVIEEAKLEFGPGFTVLTGETGAGKSILLDALGLVLGMRADPGLVRHGSEKAEIAAVFELHDAPFAQAWLIENELHDSDEPNECMIRRIVHAEGRTRAFVNGIAVNSTQLRELGEGLVEIFGQNESQTLLKADVQRQLLDSTGDYEHLLDAVRDAAKALTETDIAINACKTAAGRDPAQVDYLRYQVQELQAAKLGPDEIDSLTAEHKRLANAGRLIEDGVRLQALLIDGEETSADDQLAQASNLLTQLCAVDPDLNEAQTLLLSAQAQVREAANLVQKLLDRLDLDPETLAGLEARLSWLHDLARKHRIRVHALPDHLAQLAAELASLEHAADHLDVLELRRQAQMQHYREAASRLHAARYAAALAYAPKVTAITQQLGLPNAQVQIVVEEINSDKPRSHGLDDVRIDFSANLGLSPRPLAKVASGGELSRVSLAIQVARFTMGTQAAGSAATMIFDEVDAGIGGGVAEVVGQQLRTLGATRQVFCVTHLAQVAAQGNQHLGIRKLVHNGQTFTKVEPLSPSTRQLEVARMLGGQELTAATQALARDLLQRGLNLG